MNTALLQKNLANTAILSKTSENTAMSQQACIAGSFVVMRAKREAINKQWDCENNDMNFSWSLKQSNSQARIIELLTIIYYHVTN